MKRAVGRHHGEFPFRQRRLLLGRAHVGPQHAAALDQRIGLQLDLLAEAALLRLRRHVDALAGVVVFPAVIGAAQPVLLVAAEPQRDAAVGAELVGQRVAALGVAPGQQPLGQQLDPHRRAFVLRQFLGQQRRHASAARNIWPIGVPGPVWVSRSFCSFLSIGALPDRVWRSVAPRQDAELLKPYQAASVDLGSKPMVYDRRRSSTPRTTAVQENPAAVPTRVELCKADRLPPAPRCGSRPAGLTVAVFNLDGHVLRHRRRLHPRPGLAVGGLHRRRRDRVQLPQRPVRHQDRRGGVAALHDPGEDLSGRGRGRHGVHRSGLKARRR